MPKATSVAISNSSTVESPFLSLVEGGCCNPRSTKDASLPGKSVATFNSISNYRTNINKIPPMGKHECVAADKQQEETNTLPATANITAKGSGSPDKQQFHSSGGTTALSSATRTGGSTIVLISTKISNPSAAKMGTTVGATIKTTGTLYNIPSSSPTGTVEHGDNRKLSMICPEEIASNTREEVNGQSEMQSTSKTATILVSKHKTKTGLPLLLKKSKK